MDLFRKEQKIRVTGRRDRAGKMRERSAFAVFLRSGLGLLLLLPVFLRAEAAGEASFPPAPEPARLVNDFAGIIGEDARRIESRLVRFSDSTGVQITVVTLPSLGGYDAQEAAYRIGESWGVGGKKNDNGLVLLVKPKDGNGPGQVSIATGYGLEAVLPDAACKRIIDKILIPRFQAGDYAGGISSAVEVMMALAKGESWEMEESKEEWIGAGIAFFFFAFFLVLIVIAAKRRGNSDSFGGKGGNSGSGLGPFVLMGPFGGNHSGSWGGFSGGFGGFGGGSFGGGGASGSW